MGTALNAFFTANGVYENKLNIFEEKIFIGNDRCNGVINIGFVFDKKIDTEKILLRHNALLKFNVYRIIL